MERKTDTAAAASSSVSETQVMHAMSMDDVYKVERVLGNGAGGVTECVTIDGTGPFVRKKIPIEQARRTVWAALAECSSPFLPRIRATYEMPDWFVVVSDFVPGETLRQRIDRQGPMPAEQAASMMQCLSDAVSELHAHGIVHRDLSPSNIVLAPNGAHIIDFGLARLRIEGAAPSGAPASTPLGTWGFAPPEQYGFAQTDARSDIYSLGRLFGFALTGVRPDDGRYESLLQDERAVSPAFRSIIERCCAFEPSARFQSASELAEALSSDGADQHAAAPNPGAPERRPSNAQGADSAPGASSAAPMDQKRSEAIGLGSQNDRLANSPAACASAHTATNADEPRPFCTNENGAAAPSARSPKRHRSMRRPIIIAALCTAIVVTAAAVTLTFANSILAPSAADNSDGGQTQTTDPASSAQNSENPFLNAVIGSLGASGGVSEDPGDLLGTVDESLTPEVTESGWSYGSDGYVNYAFAIRNPSSQYAIELPEITVTGRNDDGSIAFSRTDVLSAVGPGQTFHFTSIAASQNRPASVEFDVQTPLSYNVVDSQPYAEYSVTNVTTRKGILNGIVVTGETSIQEGVEPPVMTGVQIAIVFRDDQGNPIGGTTTYIRKPSPGESAPFEAQITNPPDYTTLDVYAQNW